MYDEIFGKKLKERNELIELIKNLKLDIKHTKKRRNSHKAVEADLYRQRKKIKKVTKRKDNESFFFSKEINEIKQLIPEVFYL